MRKFSFFYFSLLVLIVQCTALKKRQTGIGTPIVTGPPTNPTSSLPDTSSSAPPASSTPSSASVPPTSSLPPTSSAPPPLSSPPPPLSSDPASIPSGPSSVSDVTATIVVVTTNSAPSSTDSATATSSPDSSPPKSSPIGSGSIIGLSVAGGIAVLGIVAFIIWKLTRKRFSDFDADGEEIKWPELNNESHALPTNPTGRVGIDDDGFDEAPVGYHRGPSPYGGTPSAGVSVTDINPSNDPYAVPPLPHLNPNQPYRDDPSGGSNYYDPYRGPVPQSLHDPHDGTESIPMSTYTTSSGSAPHSGQVQAYYSGHQSPDPGRRSPGPSLAYGRQSPGPAVGYGGRQSPGPAVGYGGRQSPGPAAAYGESGYSHSQ